MKYIKLLLLVLTLFISTISTSQNFKNAYDYLEFVSSQQKTITKSMWKYTKAIAHSRSDKAISGKRNLLIKSIEKSILKIQRAKSFENDDYKNQVLQHLELNKILLKQEYAKVIDMKAVAEQSYDLMEAYMLANELADKKMTESQQEHEKNFYKYAEKHNINIIENETDLSKKMVLSNKVFKHYNKMYLIFFKANINEVYLWEAINKKDISAIQQNANALYDSAKEGLEILKTQELYKRDESLINSTKSIFEFFIDESKTKIPVIVDFLLLNEELEQIQTTLEKVPERKRTKEQINKYNKKVKEFNKAIKDYNKLNAALNNSRQKIFNKLNTTNDKFLSKHIPKD